VESWKKYKVYGIKVIVIIGIIVFSHFTINPLSLPAVADDGWCCPEGCTCFAIGGDSRTYYSEFNSTLQFLKKYKNDLDFVVYVGDMDSVKINKEDYHDVQLAGLPSYWCMGNHEFDPGPGETYIRDLYPSLSNTVNLFNDGRNSTYSFEYNNVHVVILDVYSENRNGNVPCGSAQYNWLKDDLSSVGKNKKIFVVAHEPAYPKHRHVGDSLDQYPGDRDALWKLLDEHSVEAFFCGHTHYYSVDDDHLNVTQIDVGNMRWAGDENSTVVLVAVNDTNSVVSVYSSDREGEEFNLVDKFVVENSYNTGTDQDQDSHQVKCKITKNAVYIDDSNVYLSTSPHTIYSSGWVYFNFTSKSYTGNIDAVWGFDRSTIRPARVELYHHLNGWVDVSEKISKTSFDYEGMNTWYYLKNVPVIAGRNYTIRVWMEVPVTLTGEYGKYWWAVKPSSETIREAIASGHFYALDPWFNASWGKRRPIQINNTGNSNDLDYYQVNINITYDPDMNSDFSDIRIVNDTADATVPYWIESKVDGSWANVWFNCTHIPASSWLNDTYYLYYNNSGATDASDGDATFEFFDDFESEDWNIGTNGFQKPFSHFAVNIQQTGLLPSNYTSNIINPAAVWSYSIGEVGQSVLVDDVNDDGKGEVVFATDDAIRCLDWQGNLLWEYSLPDTGMHTFLIIDDINNDGVKEIVFGTYITHETDGYVRCLNASNGEEIWNYYCNKGDTTTGSDPNGIQVADIDGDGEKEVLVLLDIDGELLVLNADGTLKYSKTDASEFEYGVAVGDIDNDGELEYVHGTESSGIKIRNASNGTIEASWSGASNTYYSTSPTIGDIDGDGKMEILAGLDRLGSGGTSLVCLEDDGTEKWSLTDKGDMDFSPGLLADIDGDGNYEFVQGSDDNNIYCVNASTGEIKWSYSTSGQCKYAPVLGVDIDGDGNLEIIVLNRVDGYVYCLDNAGNLKWKISVGTGGQYRSLAIADLNNDGKVELIVPTSNGVACYVQGEDPLSEWTIVSGTWSADNGYLERTGTSTELIQSTKKSQTRLRILLLT